MTYENCAQLPDSSIGKVILCRNGDRFSLYANAQRSLAINQSGVNEVVESFKAIASDRTRLARLYGFHKDVPHEGKIVGGALIMVQHECVFLTGTSADFGPIDDEVVKQCLPGRVVERV